MTKMLSVMSCDICRKRFVVRPSKYTSDVYRSDYISFTRRNTKDLDIGGDTYILYMCPECFTETTNLIAEKYGVDDLKDRVEWWGMQARRCENNGCGK